VKRLFLLLFYLSIVIINIQAQERCGLRISMLTATPGSELCSTFGHRALRFTDSVSGIDIIYNYGTFDFDDPDFYTKFISGKLLYFVSVDVFENFMYEYQYERRGITEQVLNLTCNEKIKLSNALAINAREENKYYKYDFVYDNCTTRLRDIIIKNVRGNLVTEDIRPYDKVTFRDLIYQYLDRGNQHWSKFGIDLVLGAPLDKQLTNEEAMFLPDYLLRALDLTTKSGEPLVEKKVSLLPFELSHNSKTFLSPLFVFTFLFIVMLILSFSKNKLVKKWITIFDFLLFFLMGLLGLFLIFMWAGTDHLTTKNNFNIWWAFPAHFILAFFIHRHNDWVKKYFMFTFISLTLLLVLWYFLPQHFNTAFIPVVLLLAVRSWFISKRTYYGNASIIRKR
jgi:hypothetical protein